MACGELDHVNQHDFWKDFGQPFSIPPTLSRQSMGVYAGKEYMESKQQRAAQVLNQHG